MNSQIKFNSNEGGVFDASNNKVSFTIPEGDHYDLSTAYLNLVMSVPIASEVAKNGNDAGTEPPAGVFCPNVKLTDDAGGVQAERYENSALLRSCVLSCERKGNIERIQRADIVTQNLNNFSTSQDEATSNIYERLMQEVPIQGFKSSIFVEQIKEGTDVSRNLLRQPVRVKLSDVMNFCKVQQYSTQKYGRTKLELELNLDKVNVSQYLNSTDAAWVGNNSTTYAGGGGNGLNAQNLNCGMTMSAAIGADMSSIMIAKFEGTAQNNNAGARPFNRLEDHPYWVGQRILVNGYFGFNAAGTGADTPNRGGGASSDYDFTATAAAKTRYITEIKYNRGETTIGMQGVLAENGSITLVLDQPILPGGSLTNGGKVFNVRIVGADCVFSTPQVDYAELVVEKITNPDLSQDVGDIQYTTFTTEEYGDNAGVVNLQRQFQVEPEAITLYVMQPHDDTNGSILSRQLFATSYRIRIDNKDTSSREIFLRGAQGGTKSEGNDPLHIYKQKTALMNSNRVLRDLHERQKQVDVSTGSLSGTFSVDVMVLGQVLPVTANPKQVQLNINCTGGGIKRLLLAKECMRSL